MKLTIYVWKRQFNFTWFTTLLLSHPILYLSDLIILSNLVLTRFFQENLITCPIWSGFQDILIPSSAMLIKMWRPLCQNFPNHRPDRGYVCSAVTDSPLTLTYTIWVTYKFVVKLSLCNKMIKLWLLLHLVKTVSAKLCFTVASVAFTELWLSDQQWKRT